MVLGCYNMDSVRFEFFNMVVESLPSDVGAAIRSTIFSYKAGTLYNGVSLISFFNAHVVNPVSKIGLRQYSSVQT